MVRHFKINNWSKILRILQIKEWEMDKSTMLESVDKVIITIYINKGIRVSR